MPSQLHEALVSLFRNRPALAPELLRMALGVDVPEYTEARIESADLTDVQPAEYRADLVVLLVNGTPVLGIVVEVQLSRDEDKRFSWPVYGTTLRAHFKCDVCVLVVTPDEAVARWAARPIGLGGNNWFAPLVLGPSGVPVVADAATAKDDPELAVLSAMAHGRGPDADQAMRIVVAALSATSGLDHSRCVLYSDLVVNSVSEAIRRKLQSMDPATYEFQSEIYKRFLAEGRAEVVLGQLEERFGALPDAAIAQVKAASGEQLMRFAKRVLTAQTLEDVLHSPPDPAAA